MLARPCRSMNIRRVLLGAELLALVVCTVVAIRTVPLGQEVLTDTSSGELGVSLVEPLPNSTKLKVNPEGIAALKQLTGPISPIVVIGPYRSGKSFLINQMLQQSCDAGMTVGHRRETQTRGVWLWKNAVPQADAGDGKPPVSLVFFDTEGFESTGQSDAYDDRIFAFAAVIASTLIYNLAEAVRESDIEKLSFAVELANAFFPAYDPTPTITSTDSKGKASGAVEKGLDPIHMVWVIQRDFLQGKSTQTAVDEALVTVPNPNHETGIEQVNDIRRSLGVLVQDSSAFGLPQPHLNRTGLCDMPESSFDPHYIEARNQLRKHLHSSARGKRMGGEYLDGAGLADLVESLVQALNDREMPTAGSMLEAFNQQLVVRCGEDHAAALASLHLPTDAERISGVHQKAATAALQQLHQGAFGRIGERLDGKLQSAMNRNLDDTLNKNEIQSSRACDSLESTCEASLEKLERMSLPSLGRFDAKAAQCMGAFDSGCTGPARKHQWERLQHAHTRERARFQQEYNNRLYNGLTMAALGTALLCRFVFKQTIAELGGWAAFVFLEAYPKITVGMSQNMYDSQWWKRLISVWEVLIYNPLLDLEAAWLPLAVLVAAMCGYRWWRRRRGRRSRLKQSREGERDMNV